MVCNREMESRHQPAVLSGALGPLPSSRRIQFLVAVGLKSSFLVGCQLRAAVSSGSCPQSATIWPPHNTVACFSKASRRLSLQENLPPRESIVCDVFKGFVPSGQCG